MQIAAAVKDYLLEIEIRQYTPKTVRGYRGNLNLFLRFCEENIGIYEISEIDFTTIKRFTKYMTDRGTSALHFSKNCKISMFTTRVG